MISFLLKTHDVSETGFLLRLPVNPNKIQSLKYLCLSDGGDRIQSLKLLRLPDDGDNPVSEKLCVLSKNRTKDNVQKHNN
jgi:hypothetical protein